jgi:hypothetical protein
MTRISTLSQRRLRAGGCIMAGFWPGRAASARQVSRQRQRACLSIPTTAMLRWSSITHPSRHHLGSAAAQGAAQGRRASRSRCRTQAQHRDRPGTRGAAQPDNAPRRWDRNALSSSMRRTIWSGEGRMPCSNRWKSRRSEPISCSSVMRATGCCRQSGRGAR